MRQFIVFWWVISNFFIIEKTGRQALSLSKVVKRKNGVGGQQSNKIGIELNNNVKHTNRTSITKVEKEVKESKQKRKTKRTQNTKRKEIVRRHVITGMSVKGGEEVFFSSLFRLYSL
jgi:hypothetical protein